MAPLIVSRFDNEYRFLSNFFPSKINVSFIFGDYPPTYAPTVEHAFQAAKTDDRDAQAKILAAVTPRHAKQLGRRVALREGWDANRLFLMHTLVTLKFTQHPDLAEKLLATGNAILIEGNNWGDTFWGVCNGQGDNHLGKILGMVREELRTERRKSDAFSLKT